ncbi:MAG: maltodextrin glucosidase, partial [Parafannyhessea umbonata]|nr:maltodextrin glucosidase [Parafannyhessea umbonata]
PGDHELRPALDAPEWNDLTDWISALAECRKPGHPGAEALAWGDYTQVAVQPKQLLFQRQSEHERLFVAINIAAEPYTFHFDAGCGRAQDVIDGSDHDFGGGSEVEPFSAHFWLCER